MKVPLKTKTINATNRVSALNRLSKSTPNNNKNIHRRLSAPTVIPITDARQLLSNRNKPIFDARQLLSRQSSKIPSIFELTENDIVQIEDEQDDDDEYTSDTLENNQGTSETSNLFLKNNNNKFMTSQNLNSPESFSITKTIINSSYRTEDETSQSKPTNMQLRLSPNQLSMKSLKNQNLKRYRSPSPATSVSPPVIKRLHNATIQTVHSASLSTLPIRTNTHRWHSDEHDDHYEPTMKRSLPRTTASDKGKQLSSTTSKHFLQRISTNNASNSTQKKQISSIESHLQSTTILITNLRPSVTQDDVLDLFSEVGHIEDIKTLSSGCIQIVYLKPEYAERAVINYHNQLLDGQLIYVSLQQSISDSPKSFKNHSERNSKSIISQERSLSPSIDNNEYSISGSKKIVIDPTFIRQALFSPSNNTLNPVQFQVKL